MSTTTDAHLPGDGRSDSITDEMVIKEECLAPGEQVPCKSVEEGGDLTMNSQLTSSQTTNASTPSPSTPSLSSQGKRERSKRIKDRISRTEEQQPHHASKLKFVVRSPAQKGPSINREKPAVKSPTVIRAEQIQASLDPKFPSFVKLMVRSHVASGFWMGFPVSFCKAFMPKTDTIVVLEDENGEEFQLKYLAQKTGLSGGWGNFAIRHKLLVGDVLIYHLVECHKFKVYIVRANDLKEVDGALGLLDLESHTDVNDAGTQVTARASLNLKKRKRQKSLPLTVIQKKKRTSLSRSVPQLLPPLEQPATAVGFEDIKSFADFHIVVNGLCIDSELPNDVRMNYYELCCSKKAFLHDNLPESLYYKLVAGMIGETVGIANNLKACKLMTTPREDFAVWEKSLESFELLGMRVGFLRKRVQKLQNLAFESEGASDQKRYEEAKTEQNRNAYEIKKFEAKLFELKEASGKFDAIIDTLKEKVEKYEAEYREEVDAPW